MMLVARCCVTFEAIRPTWLVLLTITVDARDVRSWVALGAIKPTQEQLMLMMLTADALDAPCLVAFEAVKPTPQQHEHHDARS